ncbi:MAG: glycine oxidase ThiO [Actinomycetota bacterium]|nr:glycine oxidase ThiO [Actinomycetota bacterium]
MSPAADVAIVGGGIIGCSVAYYAARRGARVVLFEAERIGAGASGAAAGMLAAESEAYDPGPFLNLLLKSRALHEPLSEALYDETGLDVEYVRAGSLHVAPDESSRGNLAARYSWQKEQGLPAEWLDTDEARRLEPALPSDLAAGLYLPEEAQVNSPRLVRALAFAARARGAGIEEATPVTGLLTEGSRVTGVETLLGNVPAGAVVLAGGVLGAALSEELGVRLPVHPVKGEILAVRADPAPITANVWGSRCYLVPKRDGRVIVGATEEPGVYDRRPTLGGVADLSEAALNTVPSLARAPFESAWGGLRPGTPDERPILGPLEGWEGALIATGTYRNGVLLAPIVGESIAALALREEPPVDISPLSPERFTAHARGAG